MPITPVTFLQETVENLVVPALKEVSTALDKSLGYNGVYTEYDGDKMPTAPFWWVYTGGGGRAADTEARAANQGTQRYTEYLRFVVAKATVKRYPGKAVAQLRIFLPTVQEYFIQRPKLVIAPTTSEPASKSDFVGASLGEFTTFGVFDDGLDHVGCEAPLVLTFRRSYTRYPGN